MKSILILAIAFLTCSITACGQSSSEPTNTAEAAHTIKRVSKQEFKDYLAAHPNVTLIDVRTPGEFAGGTIAHAKNINFNSPTFKSEIDKLDKSEPVLIFCMSGGRSSSALNVMKGLGFEYVLELDGGYRNY